MKKFFSICLVVGLVAIAIAVVAANSVVVVEARQKGYYDTGDHYHYGLWTPGVYLKPPWVDAYVKQSWGGTLRISEQAYTTKDGKVVYYSFDVSGTFDRNVTGEEVHANFMNNIPTYGQTMIDVTAKVVEKYTFDEIVHQRSGFWDDHVDSIRTEMEKFGLYIDSIEAPFPCNNNGGC